MQHLICPVPYRAARYRVRYHIGQPHTESGPTEIVLHSLRVSYDLIRKINQIYTINVTYPDTSLRKVLGQVTQKQRYCTSHS